MNSDLGNIQNLVDDLEQGFGNLMTANESLVEAVKKLNG